MFTSGAPFCATGTHVELDIEAKPSLHPDFENLPHESFLDEVARLFQEGKVEQTTEVVALLIRQRTPG